MRPTLAVIVCGLRQQARCVLVEPCATLQRVELRGKVAIQRIEMQHVVGGVFQLRGRQRAPQPVRAGLALGQGDAEALLHQALVAHAATDAGECGGDLGVEQRRRHDPAGALERNQVFAGAVHDLEHARIGEQWRQRGAHAGHQRVDQQDIHPSGSRVAHRQLHQRQLRPVGAFADEFGIDADAGGALSEAGLQVGGVGNPMVHEFGRAEE